MTRDAGYDDWLDAISEGRDYYLECDEGHGLLPPRRVCPYCGSVDLVERDLPPSGTIETFTVIHVGTPDFDEQTPYVTAIAGFDGVSVTGIVRDVSPEAVETGMSVGLDVGTNPETDGRVVVLRPR